MDKLEKYKIISDFINSWFKVFAVIAAGVITVSEYYQHKEGEQVKLTLSYVERFNSSKLLDMRNLIDMKLDEENETIISTLSKKDLSEVEMEKAYGQLIVDIVEKHRMSLQLKTLLAFHEEVVLCVNTALCNEQVARDFFTTDAKELFKGFYPFICDERRKWKNDKIGQRVEHFYVRAAGSVCSGS